MTAHRRPCSGHQTDGHQTDGRHPNANGGPASPPSDSVRTDRLGRRLLLGGLAAGAVAAGLGAALIPRRALATPLEPRVLNLYNPHTGERFQDAYFNGEGYLARALPQLNWLMRDHRENAAMEMDPALFDILWHVHQNYIRFHGTSVVLNIHSAYRTERTNALLQSEGAAQNSYHKLGRAIDISAQGYGIYFLKNMVRNTGAGGIGIYMRSRFAHLDTGPSRHWIQALF